MLHLVPDGSVWGRLPGSIRHVLLRQPAPWKGLSAVLGDAAPCDPTPARPHVPSGWALALAEPLLRQLPGNDL